MLGAEEIKNEGNRKLFPLRVRGISKTQVRSADTASSVMPYELYLSGSQLLLGSLFLCAAGLIMWSFLRIWLFAR